MRALRLVTDDLGGRRPGGDDPGVRHDLSPRHVHFRALMNKYRLAFSSCLSELDEKSRAVEELSAPAYYGRYSW